MQILDKSEVESVSGGTLFIDNLLMGEFVVGLAPGDFFMYASIFSEPYTFTYDGMIEGPNGMVSSSQYETHMDGMIRIFEVPYDVVW